MIKKITSKQLLQLPLRKYGKKSTYKSIVVVNTKRKHDSGYSLMAVVGLNKHQKPIEIVGYCDAIQWNVNGLSFSNDMFYPSGIIHFWSTEAVFKIGLCASTTIINLIKKRQF